MDNGRYFFKRHMSSRWLLITVTDGIVSFNGKDSQLLEWKGIWVRLIPEIVELFDSEGILRSRYNLPCAFTVALDNRPDVDRINFPIEMLNYFSR